MPQATEPPTVARALAALLDALERLDKAATPGPWESWRQGNQYLGTTYMPTARGVAASVIKGPLRPWNPHAMVAFGMKAEQHEEVRFIDADADLVVAMRNALPELICAVRLVERERDELKAKLYGPYDTGPGGDDFTCIKHKWSSLRRCPSCVIDENARVAAVVREHGQRLIEAAERDADWFVTHGDENQATRSDGAAQALAEALK